MRHNVFGKKLNRDTNQRKALFRSLIVSLVKYGRIETTEAKAKAIKPLIEKIVTKVKKNNLTSKRQVLKIIPDKEIVEKLFKEIGPMFSNISSGFIRVIKTQERSGDNSKMVLMEWTREEMPKKEEPLKKGKKQDKKHS